PVFLRIKRDENGVAAIEFALLAPFFMLLLMGVLQVGMTMQNYSALRGVSADVARYAMVQYQSGNNLSKSQLETWAENHALGSPYLLDKHRINATITEPGSQRVTGAKELQIVMSYQLESFLDFAGIEFPFVTYTRPVFLLDE
ncbi:MAG: TadE family protein, partial [Alteraurantiacibacter sp.]